MSVCGLVEVGLDACGFVCVLECASIDQVAVLIDANPFLPYSLTHFLPAFLPAFLPGSRTSRGGPQCRWWCCRQRSSTASRCVCVSTLACVGETETEIETEMKLEVLERVRNETETRKREERDGRDGDRGLKDTGSVLRLVPFGIGVAGLGWTAGAREMLTDAAPSRKCARSSANHGPRTSWAGGEDPKPQTLSPGVS